jgi:hypothetical protein
MKSKLSRAEVFALSNTLACYPDNKTYAQIQKLIERKYEKGWNKIDVWGSLEYWSDGDIIDFQDSLRDQVNELLTEIKA